MIGTIEQRINKRSEEEQKTAEIGARDAICAAVRAAFPHERTMSPWHVVELVRPLVYEDKALEDEKTKLEGHRKQSICYRENAHRNELESTLQSIAWALENIEQ